MARLRSRHRLGRWATYPLSLLEAFVSVNFILDVHLLLPVAGSTSTVVSLIKRGRWGLLKHLKHLKRVREMKKNDPLDQVPLYIDPLNYYYHEPRRQAEHRYCELKMILWLVMVEVVSTKRKRFVCCAQVRCW